MAEKLHFRTKIDWKDKAYSALAKRLCSIPVARAPGPWWATPTGDNPIQRKIG